MTAIKLFGDRKVIDGNDAHLAHFAGWPHAVVETCAVVVRPSALRAGCSTCTNVKPISVGCGPRGAGWRACVDRREYCRRQRKWANNECCCRAYSDDLQH